VRWKNAVAGFGMTVLLASAGAAQQTQLDLVPNFNDQLSGYCCSSFLYPTSGTLTNLGVTFSMASDPGMNSDAWRGEFATNRTFNLPIGVSGLTNVYTLINTRFGFAGDPSDRTTAQASLTFNFSGGSWTEYLFGCYNVRDHNPFGYSASCWQHNGAAPTGSNAQQFASFDDQGSLPVVFDMQTWNISAFSGQTLNSIDFTDYGPGINTIFLRAVTVEAPTTIPEPSTFALLAVGVFALVGARARSRR